MKTPKTLLLSTIAAYCVLLIISCSVQEKQTSLDEAEKTIEITCVTPPKLEDVDITPAENERVEDVESISTEEKKVAEKTAIKDVKKVASISTIETTKMMSDKTGVEYMTGPITYEVTSPIMTTGAASYSISPTMSYTTPTTIAEYAPSHAPDDMYSGEDRKVVTVAGAMPAASASSAGAINGALAGQLTSGEINDFQKWKMWEDIAENELKAYQDIWQINADERYSVIARNEQGSPIVDGVAELVSKEGIVIWTAHTDNTGRAELWNKYDMSAAHNKIDFIRVTHQKKEQRVEHPKTMNNGINSVKFKTACDIPDAFDLLFTVDATGSMGDEISYLQAELVDVVSKIKTKHKDINLRLGSVFYRDHGDTYVTVNTPFSENISETNEFIANQYADGGGDGPEAVDDALMASVEDMQWSASARSRILFLILDAPPHAEKQNLDKLVRYTKRCAAKGIRIIPLVASGGGYDADKSLEYLMRSFALATNGTYGFLTDHSGIGGTHTAPTTDKYDVEKLNDMLVRIIDQFLFVPDCNVEQFVQQQEIQDTSMVVENYTMQADTSAQDSTTTNLPTDPISVFTLKCYPNPATDYVWVEISEVVSELFIADNSGKIIQRLQPTSKLTRLDLTDYPTGVYHLKAWINDKWASARIVVTKI